MLKDKWEKQKKKNCEIILQKTEMYKEKQNVEKYKKIIKRKIRRRIKVKILQAIRNDSWSDHPKTQFWAYLPFSYMNLNLAYVRDFETPFGSNAST